MSSGLLLAAAAAAVSFPMTVWRHTGHVPAYIHTQHDPTHHSALPAEAQICRNCVLQMPFSALTLLVGWQEGHPACKNWVVGCWHGFLSGARCRLAHCMAQLVPLPLTVSCFSEIQIGLTFLVPAHLGSPGKGPLNGCVCVCVRASNAVLMVSQRCATCCLIFSILLTCKSCNSYSRRCMTS